MCRLIHRKRRNIFHWLQIYSVFPQTVGSVNYKKFKKDVVKILIEKLKNLSPMQWRLVAKVSEGAASEINKQGF